MHCKRQCECVAIWCLLVILKFTSSENEQSEAALDIICQAINDSRSTLIPKFPKEFEAHMEVTDLFHNFTAEVHEYVRGSRSALHRTSNGKFVSCLYDDVTKQGHVVNGVRCATSGDLPYQCFCNHTCLPFIPLRDVFAYMERYNAVLTSENLSVRGIPVMQYSVRCWSQKNPNITMAIDLYLSRKSYQMSRGTSLVPVRVAIYSRGDLLKILDPNVQNLRLVLEITQFKTEITRKGILQPPPGVFCPAAIPSRHFPNLADQFSVTMETIINDRNSIIYVHHHYDSVEKLVAYELRPHHHSPTSLTRIFDIAKPVRFYRIIHDFKSGVQYMIDDHSGNCSITSIPMDAIDAVPLDENHVRLRHANELLNADRANFVYQGERTIRGIPCDVWVSEKSVAKEDGEYSTMEVYFTLDNWTVEVEVLNRERQVPLGVSIYTADSPTSTRFTGVQHTYYYGYSLGHPNWANFDISVCLARIDRLFLLLTLKVSYADLAKYNFDVAEDSIRRGIAGIAGVSPLRITNMFVGKSQDEEVDVWFVLLERPDVMGNVPNPRPQIYMADAYRMLYDIIENHDVIINVELGPIKHLRVFVKRGTLERTRESLHPNTRHRGLRYLKAGYTAGSMAGLGFSMAILGTCVGVFVGFLLWKRGTGIPYHVHN